jgi:hypothetical protein
MYSKPQNASIVALDDLTQALQGVTLDAATFLRSPPNERGESLHYNLATHTFAVLPSLHQDYPDPLWLQLAYVHHGSTQTPFRPPYHTTLIQDKLRCWIPQARVHFHDMNVVMMDTSTEGRPFNIVGDTLDTPQPSQPDGSVVIMTIMMIVSSRPNALGEFLAYEPSTHSMSVRGGARGGEVQRNHFSVMASGNSHHFVVNPVSDHWLRANAADIVANSTMHRYDPHFIMLGHTKSNDILIFTGQVSIHAHFSL